MLKHISIPTILIPLWIAIPAHAEKIWTNSASGLWQDGTNWTGHTAPSITSFIRITNDLTKTVTINEATPAINLTVQTLTLSAPPGATNTLLVANAGTNNPLTFQTGLELQDGAALRITNSALLLQLTNDHLNIDGTMTLDSGSIFFGDTTVTCRVGRATSGALVVHGGSVSAGTLTIGGLTNSTGTVNVDGGSLLVSSLLSVGRNPRTTGSLMLTGGTLSVPNDDTRVGDEGTGVMVISNATATVTNLQVGRDPSSSGTLTLQQGGVIQVQTDIALARFNGSTGVVNVAGGQLLAPGLTLYAGRGGNGQLALSNGTVQAALLLVAADTTNSIGGTGLVSVTGGTLLLASNLLIGSASYASGQAAIAGGSTFITNSQSSAITAVSSGILTLTGGSIVTDTLQLTNTAGQISFTSGFLEAKNTRIANGSPFVVGDGTNPAVFHLNGGTHTFANGLVISSNSTLEGCGTILGAIVNHGTISTNCAGSTLLPPSIATQPASQVLVKGATLNLSVSASSTLPMSYQWQLQGADLSGATAAAFNKTNIQSTDAGNYTVVIHNAAGSVTSAVAVVTVQLPPQVGVAPQDLTIAPGSTATFTVTATGTAPLSYQWQFAGANLAGATNSSYSKTNVQPADAGTYTVVITNAAGSTSSSARLQIVSSTLKLSFVTRTGATNVLSVQSFNGASYSLEYKDSLAQTNWTQIAPSIPGNGAQLLLQDPAATGTSRFYRAKSF